MNEAMTTSDCSVTLAPVSPLNGGEAFLNKLVSRDATPACVSSRSYYRSCAHVPFEWETQTGQPKNPTHSELLPPLSPPPSMQSGGLAQYRHPSGVLNNARRDRSSRRRRHTPLENSCSSDGNSIASCLVLKPMKCALFGAIKRLEFSRALSSMFGAES